MKKEEQIYYINSLNIMMTYDEFLNWTKFTNFNGEEKEIEDIEIFCCPNTI